HDCNENGGPDDHRSPRHSLPFTDPDYAFFPSTTLASRLFCRSAALWWIRFFRPARSIIFTASAYSFAASAAVAALRTRLIAVRSWLRWVRLWTEWARVWRMRFLADLILGTTTST